MECEPGSRGLLAVRAGNEKPLAGSDGSERIMECELRFCSELEDALMFQR